MAYDELKAITRRWREVASNWDLQRRQGWRGGLSTDPSPPERGRGSIENWINWLNACAQEVEDAVLALETQEPDRK